MSDGAPGPWRIDGEVVVDADNVEIAIVDVVNRPRPAWERSARLIASAPELLSALLELRRAWDARQLPVNDRMEAALDDADAAIAKATGGES